MLYLALPPIPTPIVSTLISQTTVQNSGCKSLKLKSQKSDLRNNLLGKILASSVSTKPCTTNNKKSVSTQNEVFTTIPSVPTSVTQSLPVTENLIINKQAAVENQISPTQEEKTSKNQQTQSKNQSIDSNSIGKILATVQQFINVSLYASIDNTIGNTVKIQTQKPSDSNSIEAKKYENLESNTNHLESNTNNNTNQRVASNKNINTTRIIAVVQQLITASISASINKTISYSIKPNIEISGEIILSNPQEDKKEIDNSQKPNQNQKLTTALNNNPKKNSLRNSLINKLRSNNSIRLVQIPGKPFLVGVVINGREVGLLDVIEENNTLLIPLETLGEISGFTVKINKNGIETKTPLGIVKFSPELLKKINGLTYVSKEILQEKLDISLELNTADLTLLADLPWRRSSRQNRNNTELQPEVFAPRNGLSNLRQELTLDTISGNTNIRSSSLLGGRLAGGTWRVRFNNNFEGDSDLTEYFFYKRNGQFSYQIGRQVVGLHPLVNGINLTGLQFGFSNLPTKNLISNSGASEILPRRSRPVQTFRGQVPPASFVQLRVGGINVAQQQVGFDGIYEFIDVRLPPGQSNEVEVLVFERNNLRSPIDIRTVRISTSDLLLPSGGNVQLGGLGLSGNLVQDGLFSDFDAEDDGKVVGFYQLRQGVSKNLTFESSLQAVPNSFQGQAGLIWRLANPVILSASVGNSFDRVGYSADLEVELEKLEINANSQSFPEGYRTGNDTNAERFNHSLEFRYRFNNKLNLGFVARSRQDDSNSNDYILPTFYARPFSKLSLSGRPDIFGDYLINAFFTPNRSTRFSLNTYGDAYISDLRYSFNRNFQLSFGSEFGGDDPARYSIGIGHNSNSLTKLSWNLGLVYSDGDVGPNAGASIQVLPGLFARLNYQAIPSRGRSFSGLDDGQLSLSLTSNMSVVGSKFTPARYSGISKERGAISGKLAVEGESKGFDLSGSFVRVYNTRNQNVGSAKTDSKGNFFVGNLREGVYIVELAPEELPIEFAVSKTTFVAEVSPNGVTKVDFPMRTEYGVAGKITDVSGEPLKEVRVELINNTGTQVLSGITDQFGLYRLDGVPVGKYTLRISPQDELNSNTTLPKIKIEIKNKFVYNQNLQLPVSAAAKNKNQ